MVRATTWDLDAIEQFIQALNIELEAHAGIPMEAYAGIPPLGELPPAGKLSAGDRSDPTPRP